MIDGDIISEAEFQRRVLQLADELGWEVYHQSDSRKQRGGQFVGDAMSKDWPDLVLTKPGSALFRELKSEKGRLRPGQRTMLARLRLAGLNAGVWRPSHWDSHIIPELMRTSALRTLTLSLAQCDRLAELMPEVFSGETYGED